MGARGIKRRANKGEVSDRWCTAELPVGKMREGDGMDHHMYGDTERGASGDVLRGTIEKAS